MSSVFGLNASPQIAMLLPCERRRSASCAFSTSSASGARSRARRRGADRSRGRRCARHGHDRASCPSGSRNRRNRAGNRNCWPMRRVAADALAHLRPCPRRAARRLRAISFMNEMRVASIAFAAYFASSAERDLHQEIAAPRGRTANTAGHHGAPRSQRDAHDDAIGPHEIVDRVALLQELGVRHDAKGAPSCSRAPPRPSRWCPPAPCSCPTTT